ncbi:SDR family NAD(P)-dependent oxidoreductase [Microbacterium protaetiae]|uniref:SDR family NAD(P)-dependent oxidoreductase n=1 Tax=Microbacterium protaetiae TaxID=2509458 RepID=UPI001A90EBD6|nr:SDR family oxidoreductase [Microbacterium protaetiae]
MTGRAEHRVALVTGAAGAVGTAIASRLIDDGWAVALVDAVDTRALAEELGHGVDAGSSPVRAIRADLASPEGLAGAVAEALTWRGRVDALINNAGLQLRSPLHELEPDAWDRVFAVNVRAPMLLAQALEPAWRAQGCGGSIVDIVSRDWVAGGPHAYTASKSGLVGLTRSLSISLGPLGVRVNAVAPSFMATPFTMRGRSDDEADEVVERFRRMSPLGRVATVDDVAGAVSFLVSDDASFITGEVLHVCGGTQLAAHP